MASPEAWLRNAIEDAAGCPAYPAAVPEGVAPPFVRYARTATTRELNFSGLTNPTGLFAVEIYADGYLAGKQLADQIRLAVSNFIGTAEGATIMSVVLAEEMDSDPVFLDGRDAPTYTVEQSYAITWTE